MKNIKTLLAATTLNLALAANAIGWPSGFEGVMLQGFYWDSYQTETKWTKLEAKADEYSQYFKLIWVPNSGKSTGGLGYIPIYWFTNHNSDMGSEAQLRSMIKTYKDKGVGIIADFVINHRGGKSNWTDFPEETWNGKKWKIGLDGICRTDEVNNPGNPGGATGAADEGQDFDGGRDLDHTNANVQENCKNYAKCLLEDFGYAGFRLDMVKGYAGYYTKMYNQYAKPTYSVGEYWDGSYDALAAWIESTGGESAAFDFAFKYAVNEAFASGDLTKLVWLENGNNPQPAGLIHHWYQGLAVTFIDNHDTYRDDWNKFQGNWAAANAFMICSPGTPCVFLPHWNACGDQIGRMIKARNSVGISNTSPVRVLKSTSNCYMAELTGSKGKLVVKIGPNMDSPEGYNDSQIACSGEDYCIWTTANGGTGDTYPANLYVIGNLEQGSWKTNVGVPMSKNGSVYTANRVDLRAQSGQTRAFFSFATKLASTASDWNTVNSSDRYGASSKDREIDAGTSYNITRFTANQTASGANAWSVLPGVYDITADLSTMRMTVSEAQSYPAKVFLIGHVNGIDWSTSKSIAPDLSDDGVFTWTTVKIDDAGEGYGFFSFVTAQGADWDTVNGSDRYGASSKDEELNGTADITRFAVGVNASGAHSWKVKAGNYKIVGDFVHNQVTITPIVNGIDAITTDGAPAVYYNMQGIRVNRPTTGSVYIERRGTATRIVRL